MQEKFFKFIDITQVHHSIFLGSTFPKGCKTIIFTPRFLNYMISPWPSPTYRKLTGSTCSYTFWNRYMKTTWWPSNGVKNKQSCSINDHVINRGKEIVLAWEFIILKNSILSKCEFDDIKFHKRTLTILSPPNGHQVHFHGYITCGQPQMTTRWK